MSAASADLQALAKAGDTFLGAPDFLDRQTQLRYALEHIAALHDEVNRLSKAAATAVDEAAAVCAAATAVLGGAVPGPTKAERRASARRRRKNGTLSLWAYWRTLAWIQFRSAQVARHEALESLGRRAERARPTSRLAGYAGIRDLVNRGDHDRAYVLARALFPKHGVNPKFVSLVMEVQSKRGALSSVLALARTIDQKRTTPQAVRKIEGRLRELSGWYPRLPGPTTPIEPVDDRTVLHLVKEARPYLSNGFTSRSHRNFLAEVQAGLRPVVLAEPGFPRRLGMSEIQEVEYVDGIEHRWLDGGDAYTADMPLDTYLEIFAQEALRVVREVRPAVLHASSGRRGYETALVAMALAEKTGLPFVYEVRSFFEGLWTPEIAREESGEIFLRRIAVEQECMRRAAVILTLGEAMRDELVRRGADPTKIRIVPNGVDLDAFPRMDRPAELAARYGIGEAPTFGYVSNFDHPRESQETLVRALAVLARRGVDARCVLVGGGSRAELIERLATDLGVRDRLILTGPVDHTEVASFYALIDVFVVPRIDERAARYVTPLKPFEAMAMARPLIVSDLPALREIADPPFRGLVFPPGAHDRLADLLAEVLADADRRTRLAEAGYRWVSTERLWTLNGPRYAAAFGEARGKGASSVG